MANDQVQFTIYITDPGRHIDAGRLLLDLLGKDRISVSPGKSKTDFESPAPEPLVSVVLDASAASTLAESLSKWLDITRGELIIEEPGGSRFRFSRFDEVKRFHEWLDKTARTGVGTVSVVGSGNIVIGGKVFGIEPVEPWPLPGKPRK